MIPVILNSASDQEVVVTITSDLGDRLDLLNLTVTYPPGETGPLVRTLPVTMVHVWMMGCPVPCRLGSSDSDLGDAHVDYARRGP